MRAHYLQHVPFENPGHIATWLEKRHYTVTATRLFEKELRLPANSEIDVLIVMGGPMGLYDDHVYPWLVEEKAIITGCINEGKKVLGICLGAQLLSVCLGGSVVAAPNKDIGGYPITPTRS